MSDDPRIILEEAARRTGNSLAGLSRLLRRNPAYLQQFVRRGTPRRLPEVERKILADYLRVDEHLLGGPVMEGASARYRPVPRLSVEASAGNGSLVDLERHLSEFSFDREWLRRLTRSRPDQLALIRVAGDSMAPTLADGDDILVDQGVSGSRPRDGIHVLRRDDVLLVKRLAVHPANGTVSITSDNPTYPAWHDCPMSSIDIVGRVIWAARRL